MIKLSLARTDARGVDGVEACLARSKAYIDAGADMIFPEGLQSKEEMVLVAGELKKYKPSIFLLANMTEFGKTPYIARSELEKMGFSCAIYPVSTLRVASQATNNFLEQLKKEEH
jgi:methylisocitrate lyase